VVVKLLPQDLQAASTTTTTTAVSAPHPKDAARGKRLARTFCQSMLGGKVVLLMGTHSM
jgi:hypothetical protein